MPNLDYLIHLPLLKIEQDYLPFAGGSLHKLPFSKYDEITQGAFSDHKVTYEATEPVFLHFSHPISEEGLERRVDEVKSVAEAKFPSNRAEILDKIGLHWLNRALGTVAERVWSALLLEVPAAALPSPRWSQSFMSIDGGFTLNVGGTPYVVARVQGESDHEYLFFPEAPSSRVPDAHIGRAAELVPSVVRWEQVPELRAALSALHATGLPTLSRQDRMTITVQALELLLMPDVIVQLRRTFVQRTVGLLSHKVDFADAVSTVARELYDRRSESVHGESARGNETDFKHAFAERMLAAAIQEVGRRIDAGKTIEGIREEIDNAEAGAGSSTRAAQIGNEPCALSSNYRLARPTPTSDVFSITSSMIAPEGRVCCWSPLFGLAIGELENRAAMLLGEPPAPMLMPLSPGELWELEERDVRRDFFAEFVRQGHSMAVLMTTLFPDRPATAEDETPWLERMRDLGVVALRLAGYDQFNDPDLFGSIIFEGARRLRRPTVIRQTVAEQIRHEANQRVGSVNAPRLTLLWGDIWRYQNGGTTPAIDNILSLFRRSFDRNFLEPSQRALILVSLLEGMLGRFHAPQDRVQLEDIVAILIGSVAETEWFRVEGRAFRNRVAHGTFRRDDATEPTDQMSRLVSYLVHELIRAWNDAGPTERQQAPSALLLAKAKAVIGVRH